MSVAAPTAAPWSLEDALELYDVPGWSNRYFSINERGHVRMHPDGPGTAAVDLKELVDEVRERGIVPPLLFRFSGLVKARVEELHAAFARAREEFGYPGAYRGVYPIKVNQDRFLVERLMEYGRPFHFGLEAGSKPELLAVMALVDDEEALIICNGYKDEEYVETALLASKLGRRVVLVAEKPAELELVARVAERTGIRPVLGARMKLTTPGSGHWEESGGDRSKFGLSAADLVEGLRFLESRGLLESFELLHFHLGSQISSIRALKDGVREAAWIYAHLRRMGAPLAYLDVGGGLGVDYGGGGGEHASAPNYSVQEYANDVVYGVLEVCRRADVPPPDLVTEAGRATVAHHAVLVIDVLEVSEKSRRDVPPEPPADADPVLESLFGTWQEISADNFVETFHDASAYRDQLRSLFALGHLPLEQRALAEDLFWAVAERVLAHAREKEWEQEEWPEELQDLEHRLADTYFCNFSLFQSMPDSWAIDQLFPILPVHRLDEEPLRRGVLADITCDSDGRVDRFIGNRETKRVLELHSPDGAPYYLGVFLVGAYQEILGDLHNLFGDTNTVHVGLDEEGGYRIEEVVEGDTVSEVLRYVRFRREDLVARVRKSAEEALRARRLTREETRELVRSYERGLAGYTYLESE